MSFTLAEIAATLGGVVDGDATTSVHRVGSLNLANAGAIGFFNDTNICSQNIFRFALFFL